MSPIAPQSGTSFDGDVPNEDSTCNKQHKVRTERFGHRFRSPRCSKTHLSKQSDDSCCPYPMKIKTFEKNMDLCTCCGSPPRWDSAADNFDGACLTVRKEAGHRCTAAEGGAHPGCGLPLTPGPRDVAGAMADCHGDVVTLDCGCQKSVGVPAEPRGPEWVAELFSERSGIFVGILFLPHGGS